MMKSILILIFGVALLQDLVQGRIDVNNDGIVGVSQKKLQEYLIKAIKGFRKIMLTGDEELDYPIMDPYEMEDVSWDLVDTSVHKKYKLFFNNANLTLVKGLANHKVENVNVSAKDMQLSFTITFQNLETKFPYKLEGHLLKNFLPIYGNGLLKLSAPTQAFDVVIDLGTEQGFVIVEKVDIHRYTKNVDVKVTNLMDLPDPFAGAVLDDILDNLVNKHGHAVLNKQAHTLVEDAVGGMTMDELFEYLDHLGKKADE